MGFHFFYYAYRNKIENLKSVMITTVFFPDNNADRDDLCSFSTCADGLPQFIDKLYPTQQLHACAAAYCC